MPVPSFMAETQFLYQPVTNLKPGRMPNPFPGPFVTISSPSALLHKTKTATITKKAPTMDLLSILRNWVDSFPYKQCI